MKKFLFSCLLFIATYFNAQIDLGVGSTTRGTAPISTYFTYSYVQQIFPKNEINAAGAGDITGFKFYLSPSASITNSSNWTVYVGHTTKTTFGSNTDWVPVTSLTEVFSGNITNNGGVVEVTFTTPFAYNNTDNLIIAVKENSPGYDSNDYTDVMYVYNTSSNRSIFYRNDYANPDPASPPVAAGRNGYNSVTTILGLALSPIPVCPTVTAPATTGVEVLPTFAWNTVNGASGYKISIGTSPGATNIVNNQDVGNTTTYTLGTALQYSTQYYYTISSYSATNPSGVCSERSFTTKSIPCPIVSLPAASAVGVSTTPTITWSQVNGAAGYRLSVGTSEGGTQVLNNIDLGNVSTYTLATPLANSTKYFYRVYAYVGNSTSESCTERNFTTICSPLTTLPWTENFDSMSSIGSTIVPMCWKNVTGSKAWESSNSTSYNSPRSVPNYMRIIYGNSTPSQLWTPGFTLVGGTTYELSFYYNTNGYAGYTGSVLVNNAQAMAGSTNIGTFITSTQNTSNYTQYRVNFTPANSGDYYFAVNVSSNSVPWYLGVDDFRLQIAPTCFDPANLNAVPTGATSANLSWAPPAGIPPANGYEYYVSTTNIPPTGGGTPSATASVSVNGLTPASTHYWWVRSVCSSTDQSIWKEGSPFTTGQIGTGNAASSYLPLYSFYGYNYSQQIYKASEVSAALGANSFITAIRFFVAMPRAPQSSYNQWTVYMGNTAQNNFPTNTSWIPLPSLKHVYTGTLPTMSAGTWVEIPLANPFIWDGTSNIVIAVDENSPGYVSGATWGSYNTGPNSNRGILYYSDGNNPNPANPPTASGRYSDIPRLILKGEELQPCTSNPPTGISVGAVTASTASISWTPALGASYRIQYKKVADAVWTNWPDVIVSPANSVLLTGLEEVTSYQVRIATICNGAPQGNWSAPVPFTTPSITYCDMTGTGSNDHISNVTINSINPGVLPMSNNSTQNNYTNYTSAATLVTLDANSVGNKISVSKGWSATSYGDAVSAWIDFNRNGIFEPNEQILISASSTTTPVTANFDVPDGAYTGPLTVKMRVVLKRGSLPSVCESTIVNGEVEDYVVKIRPCSTVIPPVPTVTGITYNAAASVTWGDSGGITYLVRYRKQGPPAGNWEEIYTSTLLNNIPLALSNLEPATIYEIQVAPVCGNTTGVFSAVTVFTTKCDPTPPNVTVSDIESSSARITWAPLAGNSNYVLQYRKVGDATWSSLVELPLASANSYVLSGLDPYTNYEVQVANRCEGSTEVNPWSNSQVFTTKRTCELPPPGLTIENITPTTAKVIWEGFPGAKYVLSYRKVGIPSWTNITSNTNILTITNLTELTRYEMKVVNVCSGRQGAYTPAYYFTTPTVVHCNMASGSAANEFISNVHVKPNGKPEMSNPSEASLYTDYTGDATKFIELIQGSTDNEITIEKSWKGSTYNDGIVVWIDFDRSGTFEPSERILVSSPNTRTPIKGTFSVPTDAYVSLTDHKYVVMRVALQRDGIPVTCKAFANGEVEDYTVKISKKSIPNPIDQTGILIHPNPVKSILNIKNISKRASYKLYNAVGQLVSSGIILNNSIDFTKLINGVYVIDIEDVNGNAQKKFIKE